MSFRIIQGDCEKLLEDDSLYEINFYKDFDLTFLDPPFNQKKYYSEHDDSMPEEEYWQWMERILKKIYERTSQGGAIYFMQREKNTEYVRKAHQRPKRAYGSSSIASHKLAFSKSHRVEKNDIGNPF